MPLLLTKVVALILDETLHWLLLVDGEVGCTLVETPVAELEGEVDDENLPEEDEVGSKELKIEVWLDEVT